MRVSGWSIEKNAVGACPGTSAGGTWVLVIARAETVPVERTQGGSIRIHNTLRVVDGRLERGRDLRGGRQTVQEEIVQMGGLLRFALPFEPRRLLQQRGIEAR